MKINESKSKSDQINKKTNIFCLSWQKEIKTHIKLWQKLKIFLSKCVAFF